MVCMGTGTANPACVPPSVVNAVRRDQRYFREISSPEVRWIYEAIDELLDPMEYEGSLLFDEYPDAGEVSRLTEMALSRLREQRGDALTRELAKALLCEEMCRRRFRHLVRHAAGSNQKRE